MADRGTGLRAVAPLLIRGRHADRALLAASRGIAASLPTRAIRACRGDAGPGPGTQPPRLGCGRPRSRPMLSGWRELFRRVGRRGLPGHADAGLPARPHAAAVAADPIDDKDYPYDDQVVWPGVATLPGLPATAVPIDRPTRGCPSACSHRPVSGRSHAARLRQADRARVRRVRASAGFRGVRLGGGTRLTLRLPFAWRTSARWLTQLKAAAVARSSSAIAGHRGRFACASTIGGRAEQS